MLFDSEMRTYQYTWISMVNIDEYKIKCWFTSVNSDVSCSNEIVLWTDTHAHIDILFTTASTTTTDNVACVRPLVIFKPKIDALVVNVCSDFNLKDVPQAVDWMWWHWRHSLLGCLRSAHGQYGAGWWRQLSPESACVHDRSRSFRMASYLIFISSMTTYEIDSNRIWKHHVCATWRQTKSDLSHFRPEVWTQPPNQRLISCAPLSEVHVPPGEVCSSSDCMVKRASACECTWDLTMSSPLQNRYQEILEA